MKESRLEGGVWLYVKQKKKLLAEKRTFLRGQRIVLGGFDMMQGALLVVLHAADDLHMPLFRIDNCNQRPANIPASSSLATQTQTRAKSDTHTNTKNATTKTKNIKIGINNNGKQ